MLQYIVVGLVFGSIYALAASGLVVTYVSTGVLNFAFGSFAYFVARTYYYLHIEEGWGILASAAMCLLADEYRRGLSRCQLLRSGSLLAARWKRALRGGRE